MQFNRIKGRSKSARRVVTVNANTRYNLVPHGQCSNVRGSRRSQRRGISATRMQTTYHRCTLYVHFIRQQERCEEQHVWSRARKPDERSF